MGTGMSRVVRVGLLRQGQMSKDLRVGGSEILIVGI